MERSNSNLTFVDFSLCPLFFAEGMNYLKQLQAENIWELRLKFPKDFGRLKATVFTFNHHFPRCEGALRLAIFHRHRCMSTRVDHEKLCQEHSKHSHLKRVFWGRASHGCVWNGSMVYPKQSQTWPFQSGKLYTTWKVDLGVSTLFWTNSHLSMAVAVSKVVFATIGAIAWNALFSEASKWPPKTNRQTSLLPRADYCQMVWSPCGKSHSVHSLLARRNGQNSDIPS